MKIKDLDYENICTESVPQYLKSYKHFYTFMKVLSNYVLSISKELDKIIPLLNLSNSTGDVLKKITNKLNIEIEMAHTGDEKQDLKNYYNNLRTAILGLQIKRISIGNRADLKDTILRLFPLLTGDSGSVKIIDNQNMTVNMNIVGYSESLTSKIIEEYILPSVTGVRFTVEYLNFGENLFAFDKNEFIIKDKATGEPIKALDENGNETNQYVLFSTNDYITFTPIQDSTSKYYYNNQKVKVGYYGQIGWGNNSEDALGGLWQRIIRV